MQLSCNVNYMKHNHNKKSTKVVNNNNGKEFKIKQTNNQHLTQRLALHFCKHDRNRQKPKTN